MSKHRKLGRSCPCGTGISDKSTTGLCKPCAMRKMNADPAMWRRRGESLKQRLRTDPGARAVKFEALKKARAARDPQAMIERGRLLARNFGMHDEKRRAGHAEAMKRLRHKWLPDEWRDLYRKMLQSKGYRAPEAKRIILAQIKAEVRRAGHETDERDTMQAASDAVLGSKRLLQALMGAAE